MEKDFVGYLDKKFNNIDKKFDQIDKNFGQIDKNFGQIDKKFDQIDKKVDSKFGMVLDGQDRIVKQLSDLKQESQISTELYKKHDKEIEGHEKRILSLEIKS